MLPWQKTEIKNKLKLHRNIKKLKKRDKNL